MRTSKQNTHKTCHWVANGKWKMLAFRSWLFEFWEYHLGSVCKATNRTMSHECLWLMFYQHATLQNRMSNYLSSIHHVISKLSMLWFMKFHKHTCKNQQFGCSQVFCHTSLLKGHVYYLLQIVQNNLRGRINCKSHFWQKISWFPKQEKSFANVYKRGSTWSHSGRVSEAGRYDEDAAEINTQHHIQISQHNIALCTQWTCTCIITLLWYVCAFIEVYWSVILQQINTFFLFIQWNEVPCALSSCDKCIAALHW